MFRFFFGLLLGLLVLPAAAYLYLRAGAAPVATAAPPFPYERKLAHMALNARIDKEAPAKVPIEVTPANFDAGAHVYTEQCAVCHGLPNQPKTAIAQGMFPDPPQLFKGKGVTDDPAGETYWKVANGIRLSGMPSYNKSLTETQMWQVTLLLAKADQLPPSTKLLLK